MKIVYRSPGAGLSVVAVGCLWGLYWIPIRLLSHAGWPGAIGSLVMVVLAACGLLPVIVLRRFDWRSLDGLGAAATALGGAAFMLYSVALAKAPVAVVILLFYMTPVWTTLIQRFCFKERPGGLQYLVIALGLAGLVLTLDTGGVLPEPRQPGEWYALAAGLCWSIASIGMNRRPNPPAVESTFLFVLAALVTALLIFALAPTTQPTPAAVAIWPPPWRLILGSAAAAIVWWIGATLVLARASPKLAPARVGMLLMSEVPVGVLSAAILTDQTLAPVQMMGAALVASAAAIDGLYPLARAAAVR